MALTFELQGRREGEGPRIAGLPPRVVTLAAWLLVLALAAWLVSFWVGLVQRPADAPTREVKALPDLQSAVAQAAGATIFGQQGGGEAGVPVATARDVKLRGVFAGGGDLRAAIVNTGKDDAFVPIDGEIAPGVRLQGVFPSHIVISRNGVQERVDLDALKSKDGGASGPGRSARARPPAPPPDASAEQPQEAQQATEPAATPQGAPAAAGAQVPAGVPIPGAVPLPGGPAPVPLPLPAQADVPGAPQPPVPAPNSLAPAAADTAFAGLSRCHPTGARCLPSAEHDMAERRPGMAS